MFSYLADKSGGWCVFVRTKLLLGSLLLGLGLTIPKVVQAQNQDSSKKAKINLVDDIKDDGVLHDDIKDTSNTDTTKIYKVIEQMPQFPGGEAEMLGYISKNIIYPPIMGQCYNGIQGKVILRFVVEKDGSVSNVEVIRSLDMDMDKEAVRVIKKMPNFIPGKQNGKVIRVYYTIPVTFKLE